jgi:tripartite-type tricarboxylate transporter receptor subunit TctC
MRLPRRRFLQLAAAAAALPFASPFARAQIFPTRPVRVIVAFPPGGVGDIIARLVGQSLQERLGHPVIVENRPGAGGNVGTEAVVRAAADGHTLIWAGTNNAVNTTLYGNLNFNFIRDIAMVASVMRGPLVMAVNPSVPARSAADFIAYAKTNPGKVNMASSGNGTSVHLAGELFKMMAGIDMVHVPYRGEAPAFGDLVTGQVQVMFANLASSPPLADTVPGYEVSVWFGVGAPKATPTEITAKLNKDINASLTDPPFTARLADLGGTPMLLGPGEFDAFVAADTEKWAKVVKFAAVRVD